MKSVILTRVASIILGLLYLASGVGKAIDVNAFADVIIHFGIPKLRMFAPLIISLEITLAFTLLFNVYRQYFGIFSLGVLIILSLIFLFGYVIIGVRDFGCFGKVMSISAPIFLLRNLFMIAISYYIWKQPENQVSRVILKTTSAVILGIFIFIITGVEMKKAYLEIKVHEGTERSDNLTVFSKR
ncbi:MauE/DoxX family redox-associated membrane protein [Spirosoma pulveris]